jgi:hypothetical protein
LWVPVKHKQWGSGSAWILIILGIRIRNEPVEKPDPQSHQSEKSDLGLDE